MKRLIVVSNRVAPITEGKPAAGGLAVGVYEALRQRGGVWFGWSGEIAAETPREPAVERRGNIEYATLGLNRRDYDQYYRGFSNATLWPAFHYRTDLSRYDRREYEGYLRVNAWLAGRLKAIVRPDDLIWCTTTTCCPSPGPAAPAAWKTASAFSCTFPFPRPW